MGNHSGAKDGKKESACVDKSAIKYFFETSTIHGISSIYNSSNTILRIFWVVIFLTVSSLLIWQVSDLVVEMNKRGVLVTATKVSRDELDFPCVIVSNAGPYGKSKLTKIAPEANGSLHVDQLKQIISNFSYYEVRQTSNGLEYNCEFAGEECLAVPQGFPLIGTYMQFNRGMRWKQKNPGPENGLEIIVNINESDYTNTFKNGYGVLVYIGDLFVTYSRLHNKGIAVAPGTLTKINMRVKKVKRLPHPYPDDCESETDVKELHGFHFKRPIEGIYSLDFCKFLAMVRKEMTSCGVVDPEYKFLVDDMIIVERSNVSYTITGSSDEVENIKKCLKRVKHEKLTSNCRRACNSEEFDFTVSHLRWPSVEEAKDLLVQWKKIAKPQASSAQNWILEDVYKNLLKIQIYFSDFDIDYIEQKPEQTLIGFLSSLGGLTGLYIGASVYSALEVFSFLFSLMWYFFQKAKKRSSVNNENSLGP